MCSVKYNFPVEGFIFKKLFSQNPFPKNKKNYQKYYLNE